jgi:hypothetical protein
VNRRRFLQLAGLTGGGLVASATMADAGLIAEIASWLKRKPAWSIPKTAGVTATVKQYSDFASFSDLSLETAINPVVEQAAKELAYRAAYDIRIHTIPYDDMLPELAWRQGVVNARLDQLTLGGAFYQRKISHSDEPRLAYTKNEAGETCRAVFNEKTRKIDLLPTSSLAFNT